MILVERETYRKGNEKSRSLLGRHTTLDKKPFLCIGAEILLDKVGNVLILNP